MGDEVGGFGREDRRGGGRWQGGVRAHDGRGSVQGSGGGVPRFPESSRSPFSPMCKFLRGLCGAARPNEQECSEIATGVAA